MSTYLSTVSLSGHKNYIPTFINNFIQNNIILWIQTYNWHLILTITHYHTFERMNRSLEGSRGKSLVYLISWKNKTDRTSAADMQEVGCLWEERGQYRQYCHCCQITVSLKNRLINQLHTNMSTNSYMRHFMGFL